jgi:hypothetical protein
MTQSQKDSSLNKLLYIVIGLLTIIILLLLGWRISKFNIFGIVELVPPEASTPVQSVQVIDTSIPVAGQADTPVVLMPTLYDDFNNPSYNNNINASLWKTIQDSNCDVKQENGTAVFRLNDLSANRTLCYLELPKYVEYNRVGYIESKLLAKNGASGDMSLGIIEFKTTGFVPDTDWIAQCGIIQTPKENKVELFLYVDNSFPNGQETYQTITASTEEFYKMRLEMNPDTGSIQCYANDKIVGSHNPTNANALKTQLFNRHFVGFWSPQSVGIYQVDDVVALP